MIDRRIFASVLAALLTFGALALGVHAAYDGRYGQWGYEGVWYRLTCSPVISDGRYFWCGPYVPSPTTPNRYLGR